MHRVHAVLKKRGEVSGAPDSVVLLRSLPCARSVDRPRREGCRRSRDSSRVANQDRRASGLARDDRALGDDVCLRIARLFLQAQASALPMASPAFGRTRACTPNTSNV